jgi:hypothetical protein
MVLGGVITLVVALTGASAVWLAVGPLALAVLDTLASSVTVRAAIGRRAGGLVLGLLTPAPLVHRRYPRRAREQEPIWSRPDALYRARVKIRHRAPAREHYLDLSRMGMWWWVRLAVPILAGLMVSAVAGLLAAEVVTSTAITNAVAFVGTIFAVVALQTAGAGWPPWKAWAARRWLHDRLKTRGSVALDVLVVAWTSDDETRGDVLAAMSDAAEVLAVSDNELLVAGPHAVVTSIESILTETPSPTGVCVGRAQAPADGHTALRLLRAARARRVPLTEGPAQAPDPTQKTKRAMLGGVGVVVLTAALFLLSELGRSRGLEGLVAAAVGLAAALLARLVIRR